MRHVIRYKKKMHKDATKTGKTGKG